MDETWEAFIEVWLKELDPTEGGPSVGVAEFGGVTVVEAPFWDESED